jgi:hypothetical protein
MGEVSSVFTFVILQSFPNAGQEDTTPAGQPFFLRGKFERITGREFVERRTILVGAGSAAQVGQSRISHGGDQVMAESAVQVIFFYDAAFDDADEELLANILNVVRVLEK